MKRLIIILIMIAIFVPVGNEVYSKDKTAPGFALFNMDGELIRLSSLLAKGPIILDFWASYCKPCIREMPQLIEMEKRYKRKKNVRLVLINIDKEGKKKASQILKKLKIKNECLLDIYQMTIKKYSPTLKVPAVFLIDRKGRITFQAIGESKEVLNGLERAIVRLN